MGGRTGHKDDGTRLCVVQTRVSLGICRPGWHSHLAGLKRSLWGGIKGKLQVSRGFDPAFLGPGLRATWAPFPGGFTLSCLY